MYKLGDVRAILSRVRFYPDWEIRVLEKGDGFLAQWVFPAESNRAGDMDGIGGPADVDMQHCRKWYISGHSTETEIVRTAYKAALAAVEHEAAENFRFDGRTIFDPHTSIETLLIASRHIRDKRPKTKETVR